MYEQLLINLSNEKLQQFFNSTVFKSELAEYAKEGVPVAVINFADNADVLDLIEKSGDGAPLRLRVGPCFHAMFELLRNVWLDRQHACVCVCVCRL